MPRSDPLLLLAALAATNLPLQEPPPPPPGRIADFRILEDHPGNVRDPGSFAFAFKLLDTRGGLVPNLAKSAVTVKAGQRTVRNFLLTGHAGSYEIRIPRLPPQNRPGLYDLTLEIRTPSGSLTLLRPKSLRYTRTAIDILLIIDTSTSMRLTDPRNYRRRAVEAILHTGRREGIVARLAIVRFSTRAELLCGFTPVDQDTPFEAALARIDASGETSIGDGLRVGFEEILRSRGPNKIVAILLTDGENNGPWNDEHLRYRDAGIPVHVIGLSVGVDNTFLQRIVQATGGEYIPAADAFSLVGIYQRIVQREANRHIVAERSAVLPPGASVRWDLSDPSVRRLHASLSSEHPVRILPPNGTDDLFLSADASFAKLSCNPSRGRTVLTVHNTADRTNRVELLGFVRNGVRIDVTTRKTTLFKDEPVAISCLAFEDDTPLTGLTVRVRTGRLAAELRDDGLHNDGEADDGLYRTYLPPLPPGRHTLTVTTEGRDILSRPFRREHTLSITVLDQPGQPVRFTPVAMRFDTTGRDIEHHLSFEAVQTSASNLTLRAVPLPLTADNRLVPVRPLPHLASLEPGRRKLFGIAVRFTPDLPDGTYHGTVILESEHQDLAVPYSVAFDRYKLIATPDKKLPSR